MPIKGKSKLPLALTAEAVLAKITEYDIYKYYCPVPFVLGRPFSSPLRHDENPSFVIKVSKDSGYIYHMDFVNPDHTGNSFQFVQQLFTHEDSRHLNYNEALSKIDHDFQLGISPGTTQGDYKAITSKYEQPEELHLPPFITIISRPFTSEELEHWNNYSIDITELKKYDIYSIRSLYVDGRRLTNPMNRLRFAYRYEYEGKELWKIYTPLVKKECGYKWFTNVPINVMEGLKNLVKGEKSIIVKSRKDLITLRKFTPYVAACQNESPVAISQKNIEFLQRNQDNVYISFDSDEPGKRNSLFYTNLYNFKHLNTPDYLLPTIKDWSDWSKEQGLDKVKDFLIKKEIIK